MNDQQPAIPATNPPNTGPPATPPGQGSPPPSKGNKTLVIILLLVVLLLCGCCALVGGGLILYSGLEQDGATAGGSGSGSTSTESVEEAALEEWAARNAEFGAVEPVAPTSRQQAIAEQVMAELHPDYDLVELKVIPGRYDPEANGYIADEYVARAHLRDDQEIEIAVLFNVPTSAAVGAGEGNMNTDGVSEYFVLGTLDQETEYVYVNDHSAHVGGMPDDLEALFATAAKQWPGAVISGARFGPTPEDGIKVGLTTWDEYSTTPTFQGAEALYVQEAGAWVLKSYEIVEPE